MLIREHKRLAQAMQHALGPFSHEELDRKAIRRRLQNTKRKRRKRKKKSSVNKELLKVTGYVRHGPGSETHLAELMKVYKARRKIG